MTQLDPHSLVSHRLFILGGSGRLAAVRREVGMADRRAGKVPYVRDEGGGSQPRSRNKDGSWRAKRSDAGKSREAGGRKSGGKKR